MTSVADAAAASKAGATAVGVILAESPRRVTIEQAIEITSSLKGELVRVAVFRDMSDDAVLRHLESLDVDAVQLHDPLSAALLATLRERPIAVFKALAIDDDDFVDFDETQVDAVLVDGPQPGSGVVHSWGPLLDRQFRVPVIVAGGLSPDNVARVIRETEPWGVDCASGVERGPRQKDPALVERYVANARAAFDHVGKK